MKTRDPLGIHSGSARISSFIVNCALWPIICNAMTLEWPKIENRMFFRFSQQKHSLLTLLNMLDTIRFLNYFLKTRDPLGIHSGSARDPFLKSSCVIDKIMLHFTSRQIFKGIDNCNKPMVKIQLSDTVFSLWGGLNKKGFLGYKLCFWWSHVF